MRYFKQFRWMRNQDPDSRYYGQRSCIFGKVGTRGGEAIYDGVVISARYNEGTLYIKEPFLETRRGIPHTPSEKEMQIVMATFWDEVGWDTWG
jgi:hypothetical protein